MPRTINASEIKEKTRSEIRALAAFKGLIATRQPDSAGLSRKWKCPCAGNQRLPLDRGHIDQRTGLPYNDPEVAVDHVHLYQSDGLKKIVSPVDGDAHFQRKGRKNESTCKALYIN